jgi:hypothetical protein
VLYFLYDDVLGCPLNVLLSWADSEISKESGLNITVLAIEILTNQIGRLLIDWRKNVMRSDVPDGEETIPSIPNRPTVNFAASLSGADRNQQGQ